MAETNHQPLTVEAENTLDRHLHINEGYASRDRASLITVLLKRESLQVMTEVD